MKTAPFIFQASEQMIPMCLLLQMNIYPDRTASTWNFNGVELPVPQEFNSGVYPYTYLLEGNLYSSSSSGYSLICGRKPQTGRNAFRPTQLFYYTEEAGWQDKGSDNGLSNISLPIWVNYDFYDENDELYMEAKPIDPVYG